MKPKYEYDAEVDALYVYLNNKKIDHQVRLSGGTIIDVAKDGSVVGIEVLDPGQNWREGS